MNIVSEELLFLDINVKDKRELIEMFSEALFQSGRISDREQFIDDIYERESIVPTSLGDLLAIPHALSSSVAATSILYARLIDDIRWNDEENAKYIFCIAVPKANKDNVHLKILSTIARNLLDDEYRKVLLTTKSKEEIIELIAGTSC